MNPVIYLREGGLLKDYPIRCVILGESVLTVGILRKEVDHEGIYNFIPDDLSFPYDGGEIIWCLNPLDDYISIGTIKDFVGKYTQAKFNNE